MKYEPMQARLVFRLSTLAVLFFGCALLLSPLLQANSRPCVTKNFKTKMYKDACARGGQAAAKAAGKRFMKQAKVKSCNQCHSKLAPNYERKADALRRFKALGGK